MGQQYNKIQKRRRRAAYNDRLKEAVKATRKTGRAKGRAAAPKKADASAAEAAV